MDTYADFNGIHTRGYPYPLLNRVNYINNLNIIQLSEKVKVVEIVEARALFLLNMMSFTHVFVKSKNFIFIKCKGFYLCFC